MDSAFMMAATKFHETEEEIGEIVSCYLAAPHRVGPCCFATRKSRGRVLAWNRTQCWFQSRQKCGKHGWNYPGKSGHSMEPIGELLCGLRLHLASRMPPSGTCMSHLRSRRPGIPKRACCTASVPSSWKHFSPGSRNGNAQYRGLSKRSFDPF